MKDYFKFDPQNKTPCGVMGVYYDDPSNLKDSEDFRAVIGICFDNENSEADAFFKNLGYKQKQIDPVNSAFGEMPYKCRVSFMVTPIKFYSALMNYIKDN